MSRVFLTIIALCFIAPGAKAQTLIGEYFTLLSPQDMVNSRGVPLSDFGAILQQDRANFHRFGRIDDGDQGDPFFGNPELRQRIPQIWGLRAGSEYVADFVLSGRTRYIWVRIFGTNGVPTFIEVGEGAG